MKIKNYHNGNYLSAFDCVIYGEIEMTQKEWKAVIAYLLRAEKDKFCRDLLQKDINRNDEHAENMTRGKYTWRNVRVTATERIFKHFNLPRYKRQNYAIKISLL